ncbi:hypothetical protein [Gemmatirosa kalamazoonensis]|uniref:hypothetical protein n=1 Tax=Gemmatirosa kalamazoonensis TaxID=861299 RepID=UPI0011DD55F9|nr:hypothetical protein [Gemmatirosa kalamazoonensis]
MRHSALHGTRAALALVALISLGSVQRLDAQSLTPSGTPTLRVSTAVAGSAPTSVSVSTTTLAFTIGNGSALTLQAKLAAALPAGVTLEVSVTAPSGATSNGLVTMSTSYADLTSSIPKNKSGTLTITHRLSATSAAGAIAASSASLSFRLL